MSTDEIDTLLELYLHLLDQYTNIRKELNTLQSSIHQDIARANFSSDRGTRYGQEYYDSRMRASRVIQIESSEASFPTFKTISICHESIILDPSDSENHDPRAQIETRSNPHIPISGIEGKDLASLTSKDLLETRPDPRTPQPSTRDTNPDPEPEPEPQSQSQSQPTKPKNPLHMFGILVPSSLRSAQASAITVIENVIPALASVDAEMRDVEIRIRRARKYYKRGVEREMGVGTTGGKGTVEAEGMEGVVA